MAETAWNPWTELRRREHIVFRLASIARLAGGAMYYRRGEQAAIVIDPDLPRTSRKAALAHELVHDERRASADPEGMPAAWDAVLSRDEASIDRVVAERLVPLDQLRVFIDKLVELDLAVEPWVVADEFDVPDYVAARAMRMLRAEKGRTR